jgi:hypothetical protein
MEPYSFTEDKNRITHRPWSVWHRKLLLVPVIYCGTCTTKDTWYCAWKTESRGASLAGSVFASTADVHSGVHSRVTFQNISPCHLCSVGGPPVILWALSAAPASGGSWAPSRAR